MIRFVAPRRLAVGAAAAAALAALAAPGVALADTPVTTTIHETFSPDTFPVQVACLAGSPGNPYEETSTESALVHVTTFPDGSGTIKMLITDDVVAVPASDPSLPTYAGRGIENIQTKVSAGQSQTITESATAVLNGSDGTHANAHIAERITVDPQGDMTVDFDHSNENIVC